MAQSPVPYDPSKDLLPENFVNPSMFARNAQNLRKHVTKKDENAIGATASNGVRAIEDYLKETVPPPADRDAVLALRDLKSSLSSIKPRVLYGNPPRTEAEWAQIKNTIRKLEKAAGVEPPAEFGRNTLGALSGLSTKAQREGGITAIMEPGMAGKPLPPDVQGEIMSMLSAAPASMRSPAGHKSAAKAATGVTGGPGGQKGPGRKSRKVRKSRKSKKRITRRR